ncbi:MAG: hypothetical protein L0227_18690, partial [Chloroflexi bacterium]|nr:hypothetical protein [Chloroflexota bacterium]
MGDHRRGEPERQLVDHEQPRPGDERLGEREHLLLAARQVPGLLVVAVPQDREHLEDLSDSGLDV